MPSSPTSDSNDQTVVAAILTHRRDGLVRQTVDWLMTSGFDPSQLTVVNNGGDSLGLQETHASISELRLPKNIGPAGGMRAAMEMAAAKAGATWLLLCEDDVGVLLDSVNYIQPVLLELSKLERQRVAAVVAYGRVFSKNGRTEPMVPGNEGGDFIDVDVAAWGATFVSLNAVRRGILPREELFFGYEDFDFMLRLRKAGYRVVAYRPAAATLGLRPHPSGRVMAYAGHRRVDDTDPWRRYYEARNFIHLARAHGTYRWHGDHLLRSIGRARRGSWPHYKAVFRGLVDGYRGIVGLRPDYHRDEHS